MKTNFLFPNKCKRIGWFILIPSSILGLLALVFSYYPDFLTLKVPGIFINSLFGTKKLIGFTENNLLDEISGVLVIVGGLLVAFSKEKTEDEYIAKIRLESLVWSVYVNYAVLLFAILFVFDFSFFWVMIFNMFTVLFFFIIRFNWKLSHLKKTTHNEE